MLYILVLHMCIFNNHDYVCDTTAVSQSLEIAI